MQLRKKCERCNALNDANRIYCYNCGKYLKGKVFKGEAKQTIWGIADAPAIDYGNNGDMSAVKTVNARQVVICPECGAESSPVNDGLPPFCLVCGYLFQVGIDKLVTSPNRLDNRAGVNDNSATGNERNNVVEPVRDTSDQGPLHRASLDATLLRIVSITSDNLLPEVMKEAGNVIGKNGTALKKFKSDQQISIWHTATGWYVKATIGSPLYNGLPMNLGVQKKLFSGDLIDIDSEQFMIEIL